MDETDAPPPADDGAVPTAATERMSASSDYPSLAPNPAPGGGVVVAADIFRFAHSASDGRMVWHQRHNAAWMHAIVLAMLAADLTIPVKLLDHEALGLGEAFGPGPSENPEDWWRVAITSPAQEDLASRIRDAVDGNIVVAFELPETMREIVGAHASAVLDVSLSPLRFLDDILLDLTSTDPAIAAALAGRAVDERRIAWNAAMLRARMGPRLPEEQDLPARVALLAAQTPCDRALLRDEAFLDLGTFADRVGATASEHDLLLVRPHPHSPHDIAGLEALLSIPQLRITTANTYRLLATRNVTTLVAINSSLLAEAAYLGVDTVALADLADANAPHAHFALETLTGPVAEAIANLCGRDVAGRGPPPVHDRGTLRTLVGMDWSAGDVGRASEAIPALDLGAASSTFLPGSAPELAQALVFGWHPQESWGVWGSGSISTLSFRWPASYLDEAMFVLEVLAFDYGGSFGAHLEIWAEGRQIETFVAPPPGTSARIAFVVDRPKFTTSLQIHIHCGAGHPAADIPAGQDTRRLGIALVSVAWFEPKQSPA